MARKGPGTPRSRPRNVVASSLNPQFERLVSKLAKIKILLCDVDGVLTDGTVRLGQENETKNFHIQDGLGIRLLQRAGILVGWISNRPSFPTTLRATELRVDYLYQRDGNKVQAAEAILSEAKLSWPQVCYMGDDVVDLGVLRRAGVAVAVVNAIDEAKAVADYVTAHHGGSGAVREVVEMILKAQNKWAGIVELFSA
jgi:3-deoxy-D-manno-octulosonate 8-phosphate phosphatase (KDO 8-P phosphatase)